MNVPPVSVERVQKCVVNFEIYRFLKKAANLPHPPLLQNEEKNISLYSGYAEVKTYLKIKYFGFIDQP